MSPILAALWPSSVLLWSPPATVCASAIRQMNRACFTAPPPPHFSTFKAPSHPPSLRSSPGTPRPEAGGGGDDVASETTDDVRDKLRSNGPKKKIDRPRIPVLRYEDAWVAVSKPAGLTVHRSSGSRRHRFVLSTLLKRQLARKVFPVHRLDHRTSGAILFAFDSDTAGRLHRSLTGGGAEKLYVALVRGDLSEKLLRRRAAADGDDDDWRTVAVDKPLNVGGAPKAARTEFTFLASAGRAVENDEDRLASIPEEEEGGADADADGAGNSRGGPRRRPRCDPASCSLVLCKPETGRTHQIRRHAYALGHPILGDTEHGDSKVNRWWRENRALDRLALHCLSLDLPPLRNDGAAKASTDDSCDRIRCIAPLPAELSVVLRQEGMGDLWDAAVSREPRLGLEPTDIRFGSHGRNYKKRLREKEEGIDTKTN